MQKPTPGSLLRWGYESEVRRERDNLLRAVQDVADTLAIVQRDLQDDEVPVSRLRNLVGEATEAYQRAAALAALRRVEFILPATDETKEG